MVLLALKFTVL